MDAEDAGLPLTTREVGRIAELALSSIVMFDRDLDNRCERAYALSNVAREVAARHGTDYHGCADAIGLVVDAYRAASGRAWPRAERLMWSLCDCLRPERLLPDPMLQVLLDAAVAARSPTSTDLGLIAGVVEVARDLVTPPARPHGKARDRVHAHLAVAETLAWMANVPGATRIER